MICYDLLLLIFALLGVMLTYKENEHAIITGIVMVIVCTLVYLIMFVLHCIWDRKSNKENKNE